MSAARLEVGGTAPELRLPDADGRMVDLRDLLASGRRVLVFAYPAAGTPGCTTEATQFQAALPAFAAAGVDVVGLSPDSQSKLASFRESQGLTYPLLSDPERTTLAAWGAFGEKKNYGRVVQGVIRSTFVVRPDATLELARHNVRAKGHVAMIAGLLDIALDPDAEA